MRVLLVAVLLTVAYAQNFADTSISVADGDGAEATGGSTMIFRARFRHAQTGSFFDASNSPKLFYSTRDGTAKAGTDYTSTTGLIGFTSSQSGTSANIAVPIRNDNVQELTEEFQLSYALRAADQPANMAAQYAQIQLPLTFATGRITDSEGATLLLTSDTRQEGVDSQFNFNVVLSHMMDTDLTIKYETIQKDEMGYASSADVGRAPQDYVATTGTLVFKAGAALAPKMFSVAITDDTLQETRETFEVAVTYDTGDSNIVLSSTENKVQGIFAKDFEGVTVCIADAVVEEGAASQMQFEVKLSHKVDTDVDIVVTTIPGMSTGDMIPALPGTHYFTNARTLSFARNAETMKSFPVNIVNDDVQSPNSQNAEVPDFGRVNFGVQYSIPSKYWIGSTGGAANPFQLAPCGSTMQVAVAKASIYDFENVTISLSQGTTLPEGGPEKFQFSVTLSHKITAGTGAARGLTYKYVDYNTGSSQNVYGAQVRTVTPPSGCLSGDGVGSRIDDLCWPVGVVPQKADSAFPATEEYFDPRNLPSAELTKIIRFDHGPVDNVFEGDETFAIGIMLDATTSEGYRVSAVASRAEGTIKDDDTPQFVVSPATTITMAEDASENLMTWSVALSHTAARRVTYSWSTVDFGTSQDSDYQFASPVTMVWEANSAPGTTKLASIKILNNDVQEPEESFRIVFETATPAKMFPSLAAQQRIGIITDDEGLTVSIASMTVPKDESAADWPFIVKLSHDVSQETVIPWTTAMSTMTGPTQAQQNVRFRPQTGSAIFSTGVRSQTVNIEVINDDIQTLTTNIVQEFLVQLQPTRASMIKTATSVLAGTVRVSDNEGATISIVNTAVTEAVGASMMFSIVLSHLTTTDTTVTYSTVNTYNATCVDCAVANTNRLDPADGLSDFVGVNNSRATIAANSKSGSIAVEITNDNVQESSETFRVQLTGVTQPFGPQLSNATSATGRINDNELVSILVESATGAENVGAMDFRVRLSHKASAAITVEYQVSDGTAKFGKDYAGLGISNVSFAPLSRLSNISVPIIDDILAEKAETFFVGLYRVLRPVTLSLINNQPNAMGTISGNNPLRFDEDVTVSIVSAGTVTRESPAVFQIKVSHALSEQVVVEFATRDGTAKARATGEILFDYEPTMSSKQFAASLDHAARAPAAMNASVATFRPACQKRQLNEDFTVRLTNPPGFFTSTALVGTATLLPFDHNPVVSIANAVANEGAQMRFPVTLSHCTAEATYVQWQAFSNSAIDNQDFVQLLPHDPIQFPALASSVSALTAFVNIDLKNDDVQSLPKNFTVEVSAALSPFDTLTTLDVGIARNTAFGVIDDNEGVTLSVEQCVAEQPNDAASRNFVFSVVLSHRVARDFSFDFKTVDGTAVSPLDYRATNGSFSLLSAGALPISYDVTIPVNYRPNVASPGFFNDQAPPMRFTVEVSPESQAMLDLYKVNFVNKIGKGAIMGKSNTLVSMPSVSVSESAGSATFTATLTDAVAQDVTIRWQVAAFASAALQDQATSTDFVNTSGSFVFVKNVANQAVSFNVSIVDDWLQETDEKYQIQLSVLDPPSYANVINFDGVDTTASVITNNDVFALVLQDASAPESVNGSLNFIVTTSHQVYTDIVVNLEIINACGATAPVGAACIYSGTNLAMSDRKDVLIATSDMTRTFTLTTPSNFGTIPKPLNGNQVMFSVPILNDNTQEMDETFAVNINTVTTTAQRNIASSKTSAVGRIEDREGATFNISNAQGVEGSTLSFAISVSHQTDPAVTFTVSTQADSAMPVENYVFKNESRTINAANPTTSFPVLTVDDTTVNGAITFKVGVTANNLNIGSAAVGTGTITENDRAIVKIRAVNPVAGAKYPINARESAVNSRMVFEMELDVKVRPGVGMFVSYETQDGTNSQTAAVAGEDYDAVSNVTRFAGVAGEKVRIEIPIKNDDFVEPPQDFSLRLFLDGSSAGLPVTFDPPRPMGYILDNEDATIMLVNGFQIEGEPEMRFTSFISHRVQGDLAMTFATSWTDADESAWGAPVANAEVPNEGKDFEHLTNVTSAFSATQGLLAIGTVRILDDFIVEFDETFSYRISGFTNSEYEGLSFSGSQTVSGTIIDNEDGTIAIFQPTGPYPESANIDLTVTISHRVQPVLTVFYSSHAGTATEVVSAAIMSNKDYESVTAAALVFDSAYNFQSTKRTEQTITVAVIDDAIQEAPSEDFCFSLESISKKPGQQLDVNFAFGLQDAFIELGPDAEFTTVSIRDASVVEGKSKVMMQFSVQSSHSVQRNSINMRYQTVAGTATAADFTAASGVVSIPASIGGSVQEASFSVEILPDEIFEPTENFQVLLSNLEFGLALGSPLIRSPSTLSFNKSTATGTIRQNASEHFILIADSSAREADGNIKFTITLSHVPSINVVLEYQTIADTATVPEDFTSTSATVTLNKDKLSVVIEVPIKADGIVEPDQTFKLNIFDRSSSLLAFKKGATITEGQGSVTGRIISEEICRITVASATVAESQGAELNFKFSFTNLIQSSISFVASTSDGSALTVGSAELLDYVPLTSVNVDVPEMVRTYDLKVMVNNDDVQERDETMNLIAQNVVVFGLGFDGKVSFASGTSVTAVGTITDDEGATVSIADDSFAEKAGIVRLQVRLSHKISQDNSVAYTVTAGSATNADYKMNERETTIVFDQRFAGVGGPQQPILIEIIDDQISERQTETFRISLGAISPPSVKIASGAGSAVIRIIDDDDAVITIQSQTGTETSATLDFVITMSHSVDVPVKVNATTVNLGGDFTPQLGFAWGTVGGFEEIQNGFISQPDYYRQTREVDLSSKTATFQVRVRDDKEQECDESFQVRLFALTLPVVAADGYRVTIGNDVATGTLVNDNEGVQVIVPDVAAEEQMGRMRFMTYLSHATDRDVDISYSVRSTVASLPRLDACKNVGSVDLCSTLTKGSRTVVARSDPTVFGKEKYAFNVDVLLYNDAIAQPVGEFQVVTEALVTNLPANCRANYVIANPGGKGSIIDDERATIMIESQSTFFAEGVQADIQVVLSHAVAANTVVPYSLALTGRATAADFAAGMPLTGSVTFEAGSGANQRRPIRLMALDDNLAERSEDLSLTVTSPVNFITSSVASTTLTIGNVNSATLSVQTVQQTVAGTNHTLRLVLDKAVDAPFTASYRVNSGAAQNINFLGRAGEVATVSIPTSSSATQFSLEVLLSEVATIRNITVNTGSTTGNILPVILQPPRPSFISIGNVNITSSTGPATFVVTMDQQIDSKVTIGWMTEETGGSAIPSSDFMAATGSVELLPRQTRVTIPVAWNSVRGCDFTKTFQVSLTTIESGAAEVYFRNNAPKVTGTATVTSTDSISVSLSAQQTEQGFPVRVTASLPTGVTCPMAITVPLTASGGNPAVFTAGPLSCSIQIGSSSCVVTIATNSVDTNSYTFSVAPDMARFRATNPLFPTGSMGAAITASLTGSTTTIAVVSNVTGSEGQNVVIRVTSSKPASSPIPFTLRTAVSSALLTSQSVTGTIPVGEARVNVSLMLASTPNVVNIAKTISLTLTTTSSSVTVTQPYVDIMYVDATNLRLNSVYNQTMEASSSQNVSFSLAMPADATVTVSIQTADGTARAGQNYATAAKTLTFNAGETGPQMMTINSLAANANSSDFALRFNGTGGLAGSLPVFVVARPPPVVPMPVLSLNQTQMSGREGTRVPITAVLSNAVGTDVAFQVTTSMSTLTSMPLGFSVSGVIKAGERSGVVFLDIPTTPGVFVTDGRVQLTLSSNNATRVGLRDSLLNLKYEDAQALSIVFAGDDSSFKNLYPNRVTTVTFKLNTAIDAPITLFASTKDESARAGVNYVKFNASYTFPAFGAATKTADLVTLASSGVSSFLLQFTVTGTSTPASSVILNLLQAGASPFAPQSKITNCGGNVKVINGVATIELQPYQKFQVPVDASSCFLNAAGNALSYSTASPTGTVVAEKHATNPAVFLFRAMTTDAGSTSTVDIIAADGNKTASFRLNIVVKVALDRIQRLLLAATPVEITPGATLQYLVGSVIDTDVVNCKFGNFPSLFNDCCFVQGTGTTSVCDINAGVNPPPSKLVGMYMSYTSSAVAGTSSLCMTPPDSPAVTNPNQPYYTNHCVRIVTRAISLTGPTSALTPSVGIAFTFYVYVNGDANWSIDSVTTEGTTDLLVVSSKESSTQIRIDATATAPGNSAVYVTLKGPMGITQTQIVLVDAQPNTAGC